MRGIVILASVALAACATSNPPGGPPPLETVRVTSGGTTPGAMTAAIHPTVTTSGGTVAFPIERVWDVLRSAYDSLPIPVTTIDQANRVIGNPDVKARRRLGDVGLSRYINCGNTLGSANAEAYEVRLSVLTTARPDATGGTTIMTTVDARARPITVSAEYTGCTSTGALEARVVDLVKARLR